MCKNKIEKEVIFILKNIILEDYMKKIKSMNRKEYLFGVISYSIAPTLSNYKPSSIITLRKDNGELNLLWEKYKYTFLNEYNINFFELKKSQDSVIILFYYPDRIKSVLYYESNMKFLSKFGYNKKFDLIENLFILKDRFQNVCPHEVGIFLGYPLDDVKYFMDKNENKCLMCGYWKVYNHREIAEKIFMDYDIARYKIAKSVIEGIAPSMIMNMLESVPYH